MPELGSRLPEPNVRRRRVRSTVNPTIATSGRSESTNRTLTFGPGASCISGGVPRLNTASIPGRDSRQVAGGTGTRR